MKFRDMKIGIKLIGGFLTVAAIFAAASLYQGLALHRLKVLQDNAAARALDLIAISEINTHVYECAKLASEIILHRSAGESGKQVARCRQTALKDIKTLSAMLHNDRERELEELFARNYLRILDLIEYELPPLLAGHDRVSDAAAGADAGTEEHIFKLTGGACAGPTPRKFFARL